MTQEILDALEKPLAMPFPNETPLEDVLKYIHVSTSSPQLPGGIPDLHRSAEPEGQQGAHVAETEVTMTSPVTMDLSGVLLKTSLRLLLQQLGLNYIVKERVLIIGSPQSTTFAEEAGMRMPGGTGAVPGYGVVPPGGFPESLYGRHGRHGRRVPLIKMCETVLVGWAVAAQPTSESVGCAALTHPTKLGADLPASR